MEIDICDLAGEPVTIIRFAEEGFVTIEDESTLYIRESREHSGCVVAQDEVDDLIKALQKAKELWG